MNYLENSILLKDLTQNKQLRFLWQGPYEVIEVFNNENIVIQRGRKRITIHKNNVKKYHENQDG